MVEPLLRPQSSDECLYILSSSANQTFPKGSVLSRDGFVASGVFLPSLTVSQSGG